VHVAVKEEETATSQPRVPVEPQNLTGGTFGLELHDNRRQTPPSSPASADGDWPVEERKVRSKFVFFAGSSVAREVRYPGDLPGSRPQVPAQKRNFDRDWSPTRRPTPIRVETKSIFPPRHLGQPKKKSSVEVCFFCRVLGRPGGRKSRGPPRILTDVPACRKETSTETRPPTRVLPDSRRNDLV
jgi:hypothetical protein